MKKHLILFLILLLPVYASSNPNMQITPYDTSLEEAAPPASFSARTVLAEDLSLLDFPPEMFIKLFRTFSMEELAQARLVCHFFDTIILEHFKDKIFPPYIPDSLVERCLPGSHPHPEQVIGVKGFFSKFTDKMITDSILKFPNLKRLHLEQASLLTDRGISALMASALKLELLKLDECKQLTDASLIAISAHRGLKVLDIGGCKKITGTGLVALAVGAPLLTHLYMENCGFIDQAVIAFLRESKPTLEIYR